MLELDLHYDHIVCFTYICVCLATIITMIIIIKVRANKPPVIDSEQWETVTVQKGMWQIKANLHELICSHLPCAVNCISSQRQRHNCVLYAKEKELLKGSRIIPSLKQKWCYKLLFAVAHFFWDHSKIIHTLKHKSVRFIASRVSRLGLAQLRCQQIQAIRQELSVKCNSAWVELALAYVLFLFSSIRVCVSLSTKRTDYNNNNGDDDDDGNAVDCLRRSFHCTLP